MIDSLHSPSTFESILEHLFTLEFGLKDLSDKVDALVSKVHFEDSVARVAVEIDRGELG